MTIIENDSEAMKFAPTDEMKQVPLRPALNENRDMSSISIVQFEKKTARFAYCLFCEKKFSNVAKHYTRAHKNEPLVKQAEEHKKGSQIRRQKLELLLRQGNFKHNIAVLKAKKGSLIVCRRPQKDCAEESASQYIPCKNCLGFIKREDIKRHGLHCIARFKDVFDSIDLTVKGYILLKESLGYYKDFKCLLPIISKMNQDKILQIVEQDCLIKKFGALLVEKHCLEKRHNASEKMRTLARLLQALNLDRSECLSLTEFLKPEYFDVIIETVKTMTNTEDTEEAKNKPASLGIKIGHYLNKCLLILESQSIVTQNESAEKQVNKLKRLMSLHWNKRINSKAFKTMNDQKSIKDARLPISSDMLRFKDYLSKLMVDCQNKLEAEKDIASFKQLAEVTSTRLVLFNKRRGGEAQKILESTYVNRPKWNEIHNEDVLMSLSVIERHLCEKFELVIITGKRMPVPVIITPDIRVAMDLLISYKQTLGIESKYVFPNPNSKKEECLPLRSGDLITKFSGEAGLKHPELMTSTNFKKYTATVAQIVNLTENELEWLCNHMGHNIKVHREFYRLPSAALEVAKVSKLLIAAEEGEVHKYAGKSLQDIDVEHTASALQEGLQTQIPQAPCAISQSSIGTVTEGLLSSQNENDCTSSITSSIVSTSEETSFTADSVIDSSVTDEQQQTRKSIPKSKRYIWDKGVKERALTHFREFVVKKRAPGKESCTKYLRDNNLAIDWKILKNLVKNSYYTRKKIEVTW